MHVFAYTEDLNAFEGETQTPRFLSPPSCHHLPFDRNQQHHHLHLGDEQMIKKPVNPGANPNV